MGNNKKSNDALDKTDLSEKIEILSTEDEKIKAIGELLSNDSSRSILKLLLDDTMTANQIAQKIGVSLPLAIYHLKKMQDLGIVNITAKENDTKYYTSTKFAFVILSSKASEKAKKSKSLFNSLKRIHRFAAIGISGLVSWAVLQNMNMQEYLPAMKVPSNTPTAGPALQPPVVVPVPMPAPTLPPYMSPVEPIIPHEIWIVVIPLVVIIIGLVIERILRAYKR